MQLAKALFDATNQGGMPTRTQADAERYKRYREQKKLQGKSRKSQEAKAKEKKPEAKRW